MILRGIYAQLLLIASLVLQAGLSAAQPINETSDGDFYSLNDGTLFPRATKPFYLRIMPLGASITYGTASPRAQGYRKALRDQLRFAGWPVNMVGSVKIGQMNDRETEGHPGFTVETVAAEAEKTIPRKPNLILINAGTNDCVQNIDIPNIGVRLNKLLDRLYDTIPGTTIVLSTILVNANSKTNENVAHANPQYRQIAADRRARGQRLVLADMDFMVLGDLVDGTHPGGEGYRKMAAVWWAAVQQAEKEGFLSAPADTDTTDDESSTCEKKAGNGRGPVQTQRGNYGSDDGGYVHKSEDMGRIMKIGTTDNKDGFFGSVFFGQLVNPANVDRGGELDDVVLVEDGDGVYFYQNLNGGKFGDRTKIDTRQSCKARGVRFGDVNNDGLDDFICIGVDGEMYASINRGGNPPTFESLGMIRSAPSGFNQTNVRLGDIDGDGRLDYCIIASTGNIQCWRNGGQREAPIEKYDGYWQDMGTVFTGKGMDSFHNVRFVDINGDFRSDWLYVDEAGRVTTYINNRGTGKGLAPDWQSAGVTHGGQNVDGAGPRIRFARIYGSGRADYVYVVSEANGDKFDHFLHVWKNTGAGGTMLKGDGVYYCDMRARGAADYVWISPTGQGKLFGNTHNPPNWEDVNPTIFNINRERKSIHLADFDGDGKCDVLSVRKSDGAVEMWRNDYDAGSNKFKFTYINTVQGSAKCTEGWGVGMHDLGLRFADIDGDGRADYLCITPSGLTTASLTKGINNLAPIGQIKRSEAKDRANIRFADVNGDGRADYLWTDKFSGDTQMWENAGAIPSGESAFTWADKGVVYDGQDRGGSEYFAGLGVGNRADLVRVVPRTGVAYTWFNECPNMGGDDGPVTDPKLPAYQAPPQP